MWGERKERERETAPQEMTASQDMTLYTRKQGYLFSNDRKMCTGICLGDIPIIQHEHYTTATSVIKNHY